MNQVYCYMVFVHNSGMLEVCVDLVGIL